MDYFLWPFIAALLPLPWLVQVISARLSDRKTANQTDALKVPFYGRLAPLAHTIRPPSARMQSLFLILAWIGLILAGMRPVRFDDELPLPQEARNIMLTIDLSTSMARKDFNDSGLAVSRIQVVKEVVHDFITKRTGDRLGLVVFGSTAHTLAPLSQDMKTLDELFIDVDLGIAGEQTAIGDALALAVQDTAKIPEGKKVIILLSDGYSNAGVITVDQAIELAQKQNISVYTIGIGSKRTGGGLFGLAGEDDQYTWDEKTLKKIATETNGRYFSAQSVKDLKEVYQKIDQLETMDADGLSVRPRRELFYYPLGFALLFWFLSQRRRRSK